MPLLTNLWKMEYYQKEKFKWEWLVRSPDFWWRILRNGHPFLFAPEFFCLSSRSECILSSWSWHPVAQHITQNWNVWLLYECQRLWTVAAQRAMPFHFCYQLAVGQYLYEDSNILKSHCWPARALTPYW